MVMTTTTLHPVKIESHNEYGFFEYGIIQTLQKLNIAE